MSLTSRYFQDWHSSCSGDDMKLVKMEQAMEAQQNQVALPLRSHTILGVCEAIGEDFGFNPIFLRIPLAASVIFNPMLSIGVYVALGLGVLASRLLFPKRETPADAPVAPQQRAGANEHSELAKAA
jgi:phage shock protein C